MNRRGLLRALSGLGAAIPFLPKLIEAAEAAEAEAAAAKASPVDEFEAYESNRTGGFQLYDRAKMRMVGVAWGERELPFERLFCFATGRGFVFDAKQRDTLWWGDAAIALGPEPVPVRWDADTSSLMNRGDAVFESLEPVEIGGILLVEAGGHPFAYAQHGEVFLMLPGNTLTVQFKQSGIVEIT